MSAWTFLKFFFSSPWVLGPETPFLPDSLLLGLLQLRVPLQHLHDHPLLLLRQVAQVNHGSSSSCSSQQAGVETLGSSDSQPADSVAVGQVIVTKFPYVATVLMWKVKRPFEKQIKDLGVWVSTTEKEALCFLALNTTSFWLGTVRIVSIRNIKLLMNVFSNCCSSLPLY